MYEFTIHRIRASVYHVSEDEQSILGRNVAKQRRAAKISAGELADRAGAGLTRSIVANLENGRKRDLTVSQLIAVAFVLGVTPVSLVFDLLDPYGDTLLVDTESDQIAAQNWLAYGWFGRDMTPTALIVTVNGKQLSAPDRDDSSWMINYLLGRRSNLLLALDAQQALTRELEENARESNFSLAGLKTSAPYQDAKTTERNLMAELYDIDGELRKRRVQIDKPIIHPGRDF